MAAKPHVEARSLSTLNSLAANPPQYPHSADVKESLTLYISRVPGSRDVILSPFRPQRKNVTVHDINNALYLIHLDLPTDELLVENTRPNETGTATSPRTSGESARSVIPRKPLPPSARVDIPTTRQPSPNNAPKNNTGPVPTRSPSVRRTHSVRRPRASDRLDRAVAAQPPVAGNDGYRPNPMFQPGPVAEPPLRPAAENLAAMRRPMGPRPPTGLTIPEEPTVSPGTVPTSNRPITPTDQTLYTPTSNVPRPGDGILSPATVTRARAPSTSKLAATIPFTLTLIRRDPSTNLQWNVGKISSFETNIPTPESAHPDLGEDASAAEQPPPIATQLIDIHLETSGYAKYRGMPSRANIEALRPTSPQSFARALQGLGSASTSGNGSLKSQGSGGASPQKQIMGVAHREVDEGFHRQVVMAYTKSWTSGLKGAFRRHSRSASTASATGGTMGDGIPRHTRHGSSSTIGSADLSPNEHQTQNPQSPPPAGHNRRESMGGGGGGGGGQLITQPGPNLRPKGYVFLSPWLGRCEFRTGSTGRSLKCRHILDEHTGGITQIDPAKLAQSVRDAPTIGQSRGDSITSAITGAKPVSELRFNLPSEPRSPGAGGEHGAPGQGAAATGSKRHRFSRFLGLEPPSSEDEYFNDTEEDVFDLALGREDAGGGSRGRRAKLGKLIIHDEGLKMLDLVVAANMGVWWNTWERRF
ncbi:hypothetical protein QBC32DRAFT_350247 [Pseudoneurospora amorphoporcata]|uniref:Uncharacterized protein n=1 Tax=Pseudoneurospora amorphoporcata TaxID=241081 RepID=A0AAN6NN80_9PEZI|nr:hypothetical protein QBC32DRAFT_350247 [Pseudoneurospora amorphoporcata]